MEQKENLLQRTQQQIIVIQKLTNNILVQLRENEARL